MGTEPVSSAPALGALQDGGKSCEQNTGCVVTIFIRAAHRLGPAVPDADLHVLTHVLAMLLSEQGRWMI